MAMPARGVGRGTLAQTSTLPSGNTNRKRQNVAGGGWRTGAWRLSGVGEGDEVGVLLLVNSDAGVPGRTARLSGSCERDGSRKSDNAVVGPCRFGLC